MAYDSAHITTLAHLKALAEKAEATYSKSADLTALEETVNAVSTVANAANNAATSAYSEANSAYTLANTANTIATTANTTAASAYAQANSAYSLANNASTTAAAAYSQANSAYTLANTANTTATSAYALANNAATSSEVTEAIETAIAATGHASFEIADSVPSASEAEENVLYLVMNSETGYYDIYALVSGSVVLLDDTSVDLSNYVTTSALTSVLADYVLSSQIATDAEVTAMLDEVYAA